MAHDLFISYSVKDKAVADAVCATLEAAGIRCWIAPRDIRPGGTWADEIVQAISSSRALILIFSSHSNNSQMVNRELDVAADCRLAIIPFRIEDISPSGETKFYLAGKHWLDALTPPLERHLESLIAAVQPVLELVRPREEERQGTAAAAGPATPARVQEKSGGRRFKLKKWHYLAVAFGVIITLLILVPLVSHTKDNAKAAYIKSCILNAEVALQAKNFAHAISCYEQALKAGVDPTSIFHAQIQSGLAEVYYRRGIKLQGEGEFIKAVEDLEKAASLGGVVEDPGFMADLKKAAAQQAKGQKTGSNAGTPPD